MNTPSARERAETLAKRFDLSPFCENLIADEIEAAYTAGGERMRESAATLLEEWHVEIFPKGADEEHFISEAAINDSIQYLAERVRALPVAPSEETK